MGTRVAIVYSEPITSQYDATGEEAAENGVLNAVAAVYIALKELGYQVRQIPLKPPQETIEAKLRKLKVDLVFNLFEGFPGNPATEAIVPEILARLGIPFTGCSPESLRLALDKAGTKTMLKKAGVPTADFQLLTPETVASFCLRYPCIVKMSGEHASHGLSEKSVVFYFPALKEQVERITSLYGGAALVEEFLEGREFNITIMGNGEYTTLPPSEITYSLPAGVPRILTFAAKWEEDSVYYKGTRAVCPAPISTELLNNIIALAEKTFRLLGCRGYARVDLREDSAKRLNVIEVNPNPDISPGTGAALQSEAAGLPYTEFIRRIVTYALEKN
ncbi:MAG: ATP-grasp domain-containing protein [Dehalococcoidales bacterium]|nr:ATP-grasp domain-containing protein [Dehalococcoidales bacterium]